MFRVFVRSAETPLHFKGAFRVLRAHKKLIKNNLEINI